ncbi:tyrosinase precursor (monophenol monooxygenase) [Apiospora saccharicola]
MTTLDELRRANELGIIKGLGGLPGGVKERLDIDVMIDTKPDTFNLFILAVKELQKPGSTPIAMRYAEIAGETRLYFCSLHPSLQLMVDAGIHGWPQRKWAGDTLDDGSDPNYNYCPHSLRTFLAWHRPYVAAMEQSIFLTMHDLAAKWNSQKDRDKGDRVTFSGVIHDVIHEGKKTEFRYDYSCPVAFTSEKIRILMYPDDQPEIIDNPLHHYNFEEDFISAKTWEEEDWAKDQVAYSRQKTNRYPKDKQSRTALNEILNIFRMDCNRVMVRFMTDDSYSDYERFCSVRKGYDSVLPGHTDFVQLTSTGDDGDSPGDIVSSERVSGSLEGLHNLYHRLIGGDCPKLKDGYTYVDRGGGHMSKVPVAAFDPIFWSHHCQIERLASIWQAIYKGEGNNSWLHHENERSSELKPFRGLAGDLQLKADDMREYATLGYTYPELGIGISDKDTVRKTIHDMYDWSIFDPSDLRPATYDVEAPDNMKPHKVEKSRFFKNVSPPEISALNLLSLGVSAVQGLSVGGEDPEHSTAPREWYIDNSVKRNAFRSSFAIFFFIAEGKDGKILSTGNALQIPSIVGAHNVFTDSPKNCQNCRDLAREDAVVTTTIPITSMLIDYRHTAELKSLEPSDVEGFLTDRLWWMVSAVSTFSSRTIASHRISYLAFHFVLAGKFESDISNLVASRTGSPRTPSMPISVSV